MRKKRYCLYLSRPLAHQLERVASLRHGSKSALLEEALRKSLEPEQVPGVEEGLIRRLNELHRNSSKPTHCADNRANVRGVAIGVGKIRGAGRQIDGLEKIAPPEPDAERHQPAVAHGVVRRRILDVPGVLDAVGNLIESASGLGQRNDAIQALAIR